jgi:glucan phosphoethanolaminetransferase (alkaline phosphatase superfamily)
LTQDKIGGAQRYGLALILILASMIYVMAAPAGIWTRVIVLVLEGGALLASLRAADAPMRLRIVCSVLVALAIIAAIVQAAKSDDVDPLFVSIISLALVVLATPVIVFGLIRQIKDNKKVTVHTMMAVLCIYLLMGLAFAAAFSLTQAATGDPFFRSGQGSDSLANYLYFSITTITTAGLGDFSPSTNLGRSLTGAEALIGQIYLVTVVAVIVGNLSRRS